MISQLQERLIVARFDMIESGYTGYANEMNLAIAEISRLLEQNEAKDVRIVELESKLAP